MAQEFSTSNPVLSSKPAKTPRGLFHRIMVRLGCEKNLKITKKRLLISSFGFLLAVVLFIFAVKFLAHELLESEFGPLISLSISDTRAVFSHAGDFAMAFLESIPVFYITVLLATIMLLLIGIKFVLRYTDRISLLLKSIHK